MLKQGLNKAYIGITGLSSIWIQSRSYSQKAPMVHRIQRHRPKVLQSCQAVNTRNKVLEAFVRHLHQRVVDELQDVLGNHFSQACNKAICFQTCFLNVFSFLCLFLLSLSLSLCVPASSFKNIQESTSKHMCGF